MFLSSLIYAKTEQQKKAKISWLTID